MMNDRQVRREERENGARTEEQWKEDNECYEGGQQRR